MHIFLFSKETSLPSFMLPDVALTPFFGQEARLGTSVVHLAQPPFSDSGQNQMLQKMP